MNIHEMIDKELAASRKVVAKELNEIHRRTAALLLDAEALHAKVTVLIQGKMEEAASETPVPKPARKPRIPKVPDAAFLQAVMDALTMGDGDPAPSATFRELMIDSKLGKSQLHLTLAYLIGGKQIVAEGHGRGKKYRAVASEIEGK